MTLVTRPSRALITTFVVLLGSFLGIQLLTAPAQAADNGSWSVTPTPPETATPAPRSYFVLEGDPGTVLRDKVRLRNYTKKPISFQLYGADGYNTEQDGFFALKGADEPQIDVGGWVRMPISSVQVAPMTQVDVPFRIKIPANATPGDHVGGVVAMNKAIEGVDKSGGVQVGIQRAVGARLYLRVSGPTTPGLEVSDVSLEHDRGVMPWSGAGKGTVTYRVENIGNLRLSPTAVVKLSGLGGRDVDTVRSKGLVDLLPGQSVVLTESVDGIRWADRVTTTVSLSTPEGASAEARDVTWLVPWLGILLFLVLLAVAGWLIHRKRTETRRGLQAAETAPLISVPAER